MPRHPDDLEGYLAVLDSNTLISAAILPGSTPDRALARVRRLGRPVFSRDTLLELDLVLRRPKFDRYLSSVKRLAYLEILSLDALVIEVPDAVSACRDPKDDKFLSLALAARASHLITGDADLLALHPFRGVSILTARAFLAL